MKIEFKDYKDTGKFILNPYWEEYILNLLAQGYYGEVWEEVQDSMINIMKLADQVERIAYSKFNIIMEGMKNVQKN